MKIMNSSPTADTSAAATTTTTILTADGLEQEVVVSTAAAAATPASPKKPSLRPTLASSPSLVDQQQGEGCGGNDSDSDSDSSSLLKPRLKKNVSFGHLDELTFPVEKQKGEHRHEMAYPMTLGSFCVGQESWTIDDYERERPSHLRERGSALKTKMDERRLIIKACKELAKEFNRAHEKQHRRRNSIGNGEINRWSQLTDFFSGSGSGGSSNNSSSSNNSPSNSPSSKPTATATSTDTTKTTVSASGRPQLKRQNSIGNGEISRLSTNKSSSSSAVDRNSSSSNSGGGRIVSKLFGSKSTTSSGRPQLKRQNSIGNGEISRLSASSSVNNGGGGGGGRMVSKLFGSITNSIRKNDSSSNLMAINASASFDASSSNDSNANNAAVDDEEPGPRRNRTQRTRQRSSSIGNGEISRIVESNSSNSGKKKPSFLKRFTSTKKNSSPMNNGSTVNPKSFERQQSG